MSVARGYQNYRGRRSAGRIALIVLLVLVVLTACGYMYAQRYVVYTSDGKWHFEWPWTSSQPSGEDEPPTGGEDQTPVGGGDVNLVVDPPEAPPENSTPVSQPDQRLLGLSALPADGAELERLLTDAGASGFVYAIRDNTGRVLYDSPSAQTQAAQRETGMETLAALCDGSYAAALFNCFHDSYYAYVYTETAGIAGKDGHVWRDELNYHWLDPAKEEARQYVIGLAAECAQMGFDELILEEMCYPTGGQQDRIDWSGSTMGKTEALELFLRELRVALVPYNSQIRISLLLDEALIYAGGNETSGVDLAVLLPYVDAVYAKVGDLAAAQELLGQYMEEPVRLVPIVTEGTEGDVWYLPAQ